MAYEIVVVGTSWGGLTAVRELVDGLPAGFGLAMIVVQHRHRDSNHLLPNILQDATAMNVCEVEDKAPVVGGNVYIAPADYHLLVDEGCFSLSTEEPVRFSRPSIDLTFESVADAYGARAIGVVLTGANADGSAGLRRVVDRGGLAFIQDPDSAESSAMPAAARKAVPEAQVLSIGGIARELALLAAREDGATSRAASQVVQARVSRVVSGPGSAGGAGGAPVGRAS